MSEYAYSEELGTEVSSYEAHNKSLPGGELTNSKAFRCADIKCAVPLTLINFGKSKTEGAKNIGFRVSYDEKKHTSQCNYTSKNNSVQNELDLNDFRSLRNSIREEEVIKMISEEPKTVQQTQDEADSKERGNKSYQQMNRLTKPGNITNKKRRFSAVRSLTEAYLTTNEVDKRKKLIEINNEKQSMDDLFINVDKQHYITLTDKYHIFYGKARICKPRKDRDLISFVFQKKVVVDDKSWSLNVATNRSSLSSKVQSYIDDGNYYLVYCMIRLDPNTNKSSIIPYYAKGFKKKMYKNIVVYPC